MTRKMVRRRAGQLAFIKGRSRKKVLESDFKEAQAELTGKERLEPNPTPAEQLPEDARWRPVPESAGRKAKTRPAPDEQTVNQELVEEGAADAEHDQMDKATRAALRRDRLK